MSQTHLPLDGLRVLDFSHAAAAPFATMFLADMGAVVPFGVATACLLVNATVAVRFSTIHQDDGKAPADDRRRDSAGR